MSERANFDDPSTTPVRLGVDACPEIKEAFRLVVNPRLQHEFGKATLTIVARDILLPLSESGDWFEADLELAIANYMQRLGRYSEMSFETMPKVGFRLDEGGNLRVAMSMAVSKAQEGVFASRPFETVHTELGPEGRSIGLQFMLPRVVLLPNTAPDELLSKGEAAIKSVFGMKDPSAGKRGRSHRNPELYVNHLRVRALRPNQLKHRLGFMSRPELESD